MIYIAWFILIGGILLLLHITALVFSGGDLRDYVRFIVIAYLVPGMFLLATLYISNYYGW